VDTVKRDLIRTALAGAGAIVLAPLAAGARVEGTGAPADGLPWKYTGLDPDATADRAYRAHRTGLGCCYGVFEGIIGQLREQFGAPYSGIPSELFAFGEGGIAGAATVCGALNGAAAAIFLTAGGTDEKKKARAFEMIREVFGWYEQEPLPDYRPGDAGSEVRRVAARSPLCHVSVSRWCEATGLKSFSKERSERCARMSASTARQAVRILNAERASSFVASHPLSSEVTSCRSCHDSGGVLEDTRTTMDCGVCHFSGETRHPE
jgi:hypothetical protein